MPQTAAFPYVFYVWKQDMKGVELYNRAAELVEGSAEVWTQPLFSRALPITATDSTFPRGGRERGLSGPGGSSTAALHTRLRSSCFSSSTRQSICTQGHRGTEVKGRLVRVANANGRRGRGALAGGGRGGFLSRICRERPVTTSSLFPRASFLIF